jgi:hypothetical protein
MTLLRVQQEEKSDYSGAGEDKTVIKTSLMADG